MDEASRRAMLASWGPPVLASLALALHARVFDFVCDDAFLALREAQNLALHGDPVYNLGERVEVGTSPAWVVLLAIGLLARVPPVALLQGLAFAGGVLLLFAAWSLAERVLERWLARVFVLAALVLAAPVGAWSSGGLEACLFGACATFALVRLDVFDHDPGTRTATTLGAALGLACLVRLEGLLLLVSVVLSCRADRRIVRALAVALAPVAALTCFRLAHYGLPLPHTFYVKTGGGTGMALHGLRYVAFFASEWGIVLVLALFAAPFFAAPSAVVRATRLWAPLVVAYVVVIGGDFLDHFRFFLPLLPALFVSLADAGTRWLDRREISPRLRLTAGVAVLLFHSAKQVPSTIRSFTADPRRLEVGVEPIGWTRSASQTWARTGQWLAGVAEPGDTLATSAAGATPFFSGLPTYDLLGLAAPDVAREGAPHWVRPGHTRFARVEQIERRAPTFLQLASDEGWEARGYVAIDARVDDALTIHLLVRRDRVSRLLARPDVTRAPSS